MSAILKVIIVLYFFLLVFMYVMSTIYYPVVRKDQFMLIGLPATGTIRGGNTATAGTFFRKDNTNYYYEDYDE